MKNSSKKPKKTKILLPSADFIKQQKKTLLVFPPINLRSLFDKNQLSENFSAAEEALLLLTLKDQSETLLESLGVEVGTANCWERGFRILARIHHGAGQVEVGFAKHGAKKWTQTHDQLLSGMVFELAQNGISANQALKQIADTPSKRKEFPVPTPRKSSKADKTLIFKRLQDRWKRHSKKWNSLLTLQRALGSSASFAEKLPSHPSVKMVEVKST